jgi:hypothetical protein
MVEGRAERFGRVMAARRSRPVAALVSRLRAAVRVRLASGWTQARLAASVG